MTPSIGDTFVDCEGDYCYIISIDEDEENNQEGMMINFVFAHSQKDMEEAMADTDKLYALDSDRYSENALERQLDEDEAHWVTLKPKNVPVKNWRDEF